MPLSEPCTIDSTIAFNYVSAGMTPQLVESMYLLGGLEILERSPLTPVINRKAVQVLAPLTGVVVLVEVIEENDENNNDHNEEGYSHEPPSPPEWLPSFEETNRVLEEVRGRLARLGRYGCIRKPIAHSSSQRVGRVQNTNTEGQSHQKTANMDKVVQTGQKSKHKGDHHVENDKEEVLDWVASVLPRVEEIKEN